MTTTDPAVADVRHRFPGLDGWARLDGPAGTLVLDTAADAMAAYLRSPDVANTGGDFAATRATGELVEHARAQVARLVGAQSDEVVFGPSSTALLMSFTRALARQWGPGDRIVCTQLDHDANVAPWLLAARDRGAEVAFLPVDPADGTLDVEPLADLCADGRTRWVAISGASNLTGHAPDLARAVELAHAGGARVLVDGVARVPHLPTDAAGLDLDALVTSPYKWYGPHAGALVVRHGLLHEVEPYRVRPADYEGPERWELGTPSFETLAGVAAAAEFMLASDHAAVQAEEHRLLVRLQTGLESLPRVTVHGPPPEEGRAPTLVFTVAGLEPHEVAGTLAERRIAVWSGDNYACELVDAMGLRSGGGAVRAGIVRYTTDDDVDRLLEAVADLTPGS
jgi:cysteine desulfurase family protein (TIGR01976 family)